MLLNRSIMKEARAMSETQPSKESLPSTPTKTEVSSSKIKKGSLGSLHLDAGKELEGRKKPGHMGTCRVCGKAVLLSLVESDLPMGEVVTGVLIFCKEHEGYLDKMDKKEK